MKKTVLITGSSSGIGLETALLFHQNNWNVAATMRHPESRKTELHEINEIQKLHLDVKDKESIKSAIQSTVEKFGKIDAIVNNAGFALVGPFEESTDAQIRDQFDTNVFGVMDVVRKIIPHFRGNKGGTIVNVASVGGRVTFPYYSLYHGTKWALEGFSESLHHELKEFNIKVKIIEPGPVKTNFYDSSMKFTSKEGGVYNNKFEKAFKMMNSFGEKGASPKRVAKTIYKAASSNNRKLRYPVGSMGMLLLRKLLPDSIFNGAFGYVIMR